MGNFDDLIPQKKKGSFDDLIPATNVDEKPTPVKNGYPAYGGLEGAKRLAFGGGTGYFSAPGSEDVLPAFSQAIGGTTPAGYFGSVGGAALGQGARQGIRALRGQCFDPKAMDKEMMRAATGEAIFRGAGKLATPITNRLMIAALKPSREVIKQNPNFGWDAAKQGFIGTLGNMKKQASEVINKNVPLVKKLLSGKPQKIKTADILYELDELKRPYTNVGDEAVASSIDDLKNALLKKADQQGFIGVEDAQQFKQDLYSVLKDSQWGKGVGEIPLKATGRKKAAFGLRKEIESAVPEVSQPNKAIGTSVGALEGISNQQQKSLIKSVLPWVETIGTAGSLLTGNPLIAGAILGRRALMSPSALSVLGQTTRMLSKHKIGRPITLAASEIARRSFGPKK